jgi:hypothetical protein
VLGEHAPNGASLYDAPSGLFCGEGAVTRGLVPIPRFFETLSGVVTWRSPLRISVDDDWSSVVKNFGLDLEKSVGWAIEIVERGEECDVEILRLPELDREA